MFLYGIDPKTEERGFFCVTAEGKIFFSRYDTETFWEEQAEFSIYFFSSQLGYLP